MYHTYGKQAVEENLRQTQFAYRQGGNCTDALLTIEHHICKFLDGSNCEAVRLFTMDFSKAFDSVKHNLLSAKLKQLPLNLYIINWYHVFLSNRQQRISVNGHSCDWVRVDKGTMQGSVGCSYLFNVFLNDLEVFMNVTPVLLKYADDSTIAAPVWNDSDTSAEMVDQFLSWSINNQMLCNPSKCKELILRKKDSSGTRHQYAPINNIPQCDSLVLLRLTFQPNCKFSEHVKFKHIIATHCLHILRTLRKELFSQKEIDHLFSTLVLPILTYGLAVYSRMQRHIRDLDYSAGGKFKR